MALSLTFAFPTLAALLLTAALWVWCSVTTGGSSGSGSGDIGGAIGGAFVVLATAVGTLLIWLVRACLAIWAGV